MEEKIEIFLDKILEIAKEKFLENKELALGSRDTCDLIPCFEFIPSLNICRFYYEIREFNYFDSWIDAKSDFHKCDSANDAWDIFEENIKEELNYKLEDELMLLTFEEDEDMILSRPEEFLKKCCGEIDNYSFYN